MPHESAAASQKSRGSKRAQRSRQLTTIVSYAAVLALIASVVSVGYQSPVQQQMSSRGAGTSVIEAEQVSVDQIVAANLAASTAQIADLSVASNVANLSISLNAKENLSQNDDNLLTKPQIVQPNAQRGVSSYRTVTGDTVQSVAARFGLTADTVKWANNIASDSLSPDVTLVIPGTNGVVYTTKDGDTIPALAQKYGADAARIISYNDLEVSGLAPGMRIVIPGGILPENERPRLPVTSSSGGSVRISGASAAVAGNKYDYGYCTWYAYNKRAQIGRPVGSFWGNAVTWASYARSSGYLVNNTPAVGAVMQNGGGYGHVAFVESVGADGSVTVSEMNYAGWNVVSTRTISAGQASGYNYIH
ncbi:LysM peptidoglycan-binding domain-containing protein [Candidatus Saccharibacteria bacterium]|nr:MAG: LysM peptidoglycan-binding domain-containing protein [Candidatus Saccharibacteria bacterium]